MDKKSKSLPRQPKNPEKEPPLSISESLPPGHAHYEQLGVLDAASVYIDCDYKEPVADIKKLRQKVAKSQSFKNDVPKPGKPVRQKKTKQMKNPFNTKVVVIMVCGLVAIVLVLVNFGLGVAGVTRQCCSKCSVQEVNQRGELWGGQVLTTSHLPMNAEVIYVTMALANVHYHTGLPPFIMCEKIGIVDTLCTYDSKI